MISHSNRNLLEWAFCGYSLRLQIYSVFKTLSLRQYQVEAVWHLISKTSIYTVQCGYQNKWNDHVWKLNIQSHWCFTAYTFSESSVLTELDPVFRIFIEDKALLKLREKCKSWSKLSFQVHLYMCIIIGTLQLWSEVLSRTLPSKTVSVILFAWFFVTFS